MQGEAMVLLGAADNDLKAKSEGMQDFLDPILSGISSQELTKPYMEKDICMLCGYVYRTISVLYGVAWIPMVSLLNCTCCKQLPALH